MQHVPDTPHKESDTIEKSSWPAPSQRTNQPVIADQDQSDIDPTPLDQLRSSHADNTHDANNSDAENDDGNIKATPFPRSKSFVAAWEESPPVDASPSADSIDARSSSLPI
jgi:hypothetical protein